MPFVKPLNGGSFAMAHRNPGAGIILAFVCLFILGFMPIISNSRPLEFGALSFAFFLSAWQLLFSLPLFLKELVSSNRGIFDARLPAGLKRKTIIIILLTGIIFGLSTYVYVLAIEKAGAVSAAIAIQAYPLFAILWETLFLKKRKSPLELAFTFLLLGALYYLATSGTWQISGFSFWFAFALAIPFLWSVAHVIIKQVLDNTPIPRPGDVFPGSDLTPLSAGYLAECGGARPVPARYGQCQFPEIRSAHGAGLLPRTDQLVLCRAIYRCVRGKFNHRPGPGADNGACNSIFERDG